MSTIFSYIFRINIRKIIIVIRIVPNLKATIGIYHNDIFINRIINYVINL
jgi:hypothetical protein